MQPVRLCEIGAIRNFHLIFLIQPLAGLERSCRIVINGFPAGRKIGYSTEFGKIIGPAICHADGQVELLARNDSVIRSKNVNGETGGNPKSFLEVVLLFIQQEADFGKSPANFPLTWGPARPRNSMTPAFSTQTIQEAQRCKG